MKEKLMVIDGNSILNRAFYGLQGPKLLSTKDGLYTNAVFGFINIILRYLEEEKPDYLCVAFDLKAPTFRHKEYEGYKAKRKGMPEELVVQVPVAKELLDAMNIKRLEVTGYEADDIIGTVASMSEKNGVECVIITGDRDSLQLVSQNTYVKLVTTKGGKNDTEKYDYDAVLRKYGVTPERLIDIKGLMGDPSDNIPGVPGIGEKTAIDLIKEYGCIENLYDNLDGMAKKKNLAEKLEQNHEMATLSKRLSTIVRDVPLDIGLSEMRRAPYDPEKLYDLLNRLEFRSIIEKLKISPGQKAGESYSLKSIVKLYDIRELHEFIKKIQSAGKVSIFAQLKEDRLPDYVLEGLGMAVNENEAVYITPGGDMTEDSILSELKTILEDEDIKKIGHNFKPMIVFLKGKDIELAGISVDTMIGDYLLEPSREAYEFEDVVKDILNIDMKSEKDNESFSGTAAAVLKLLAEKIEKKINENGQQELFSEIEIPLICVLADMEYTGFRIDADALRKFSKELDQKITFLTNSIYMLAGEEFNINSTKQLGVILFEKLKLPVVKKTKTGYSTDVEVLEELAQRHEIVSQILEYRQLVKLKTTYTDALINLINPRTGKIHSRFNQTVTVTGRISSTEPNLQNIPVKLDMGRSIRKVFTASDKDHVLADADYSQIELRVLAHITGDSALVDAFTKGDDIHALTASQIFGVPVQSVTPYMRSRAKTVNFSVIYGIGAYSLSRDLKITRKEAEKYISDYFTKYPGVKKYMSDIIAEASRQGFVTTIFNRRRYMPELKSSNFNIKSFGERVAMNTPIQGTAADIIKIAMVRVHQELKKRKLKSKLVLQVHDELIIDVYKDEEEEVKRIMKDCMEHAVTLKVPLYVEVRTGDNWYEAK